VNPHSQLPICSADGPIIVTGGAGFIGSNLVAEILRREPRRHVIVIDDFRSSASASITEACQHAGVGPFSGTLVPKATHEIKWSSFFKRFRPAAVFHLAAITDTTVSDERLMIEVNTGGFRDLLRESHRNKTPLVYASSAATYGSPPAATEHRPFPTSEAGFPNNVYGLSKWLMENEHRRYAQTVTGRPAEGWEHARIPSSSVDGGAPHAVGLRYFNVFGPGESRKKHMASLAHQLAHQMLNGHNPRIFSPGDQARDQVPVQDVVNCTIAAAADTATPGIYNLGSGTPTTFNEVVDAVREGLGFSPDERPTEYFEMPPDIARFYQSFTLADMTETERALGWTPQHQPDRALRDYAATIKQAHRAKSRPLSEAT